MSKHLKNFVALWSIPLIAGCAGTPHWTQETPDELRSYYYQGIGYSETIERADRNAYAALVADREGFHVEAITEDMVRSVRKNETEEIFEVFTDKGTITIRGGVPSGAYMAGRWHKGSNYWSYALLERPEKKAEIGRRRDDRLHLIGLKSLVPGWAQFTKGQRLKGWRILGIEGLSLAGTVALGVVAQDLTTRRDRSRTSSDRDYYDLWANRAYWGSVACGLIAGGTYVYSLIDGMTSEPKTHLLLSSEGGIRVFAGVRRESIVVALRYPFP